MPYPLTYPGAAKTTPSVKQMDMTKIHGILNPRAVTPVFNSFRLRIVGNLLTAGSLRNASPNPTKATGPTVPTTGQIWPRNR